MKRLVHALFAAVLLAVAGTVFLYTPYGQRVEEEFGLALLFKLRGPRQPPDKSVIVTIDHDSSKKLGLTEHYSKWPRTVHAAMVDRLVQFGAHVIAFDIHFAEEKQHDQDMAFARAMRNAGNVILVEKLEHETRRSASPSEQAGRIEIEVQIPPIKPLAEACLALAPFPLPKLPVRVDSAWLFKSTSGDTPTMPATVFQAAVLSQYDILQSLLDKKVTRDVHVLTGKVEQTVADPGLVDTMRILRGLFRQNRGLQEDLVASARNFSQMGSKAESNRHLLTLIDMYAGAENVFIDFYGPPATFTTFSYYDILSANDTTIESIAEKIRGRVVFIGAAWRTWSSQKDGFYTIFSQEDGLDVSGVELAATVFSNLFEGRSVRKLAVIWSIVLLFLGAAIVCLVSFLLQPILAGVVLVGMTSIALFGAHQIFSVSAIWTPLITPLVLLPLVAFLTGTLTNYLTTQRERQRIGKAMGFYLPDNVVEELAKDLSFIERGEKKVYSTCLMTDAHNYTTLAERISPEELSRHMKEYYQCMFREVKKIDGVVGNVLGDSMLALWPSAHPAPSQQINACRAALKIVDAVGQFNARHPQQGLPTRMGLHSGYILMDNIGAEDHYEYAPVGDIVNTAQRIEDLNKYLATQVLASEETLRDVEGIDSREVGVFLLAGKTTPLKIHELYDGRELTDERNLLNTEAFPRALELFRSGQWEATLEAFDDCLKLHQGDGPSIFYSQLCGHNLENPPPADWQGVVKLGKHGLPVLSSPAG